MIVKKCNHSSFIHIFADKYVFEVKISIKLHFNYSLRCLLRLIEVYKFIEVPQRRKGKIGANLNKMTA